MELHNNNENNNENNKENEIRKRLEEQDHTSFMINIDEYFTNPFNLMLYAGTKGGNSFNLNKS